MVVAAFVVSCVAVAISGFALFLTWRLAGRRERFDRQNAEQRERFDRQNAERTRRQDSYERLSANVEIILKQWGPRKPETRATGTSALVGVRQELFLEHGCIPGDKHTKAIDLLEEIEGRWSTAEQMADEGTAGFHAIADAIYLVDLTLMELRYLAEGAC